jgi:hypothetical protein
MMTNTICRSYFLWHKFLSTPILAIPGPLDPWT